MESELDRYVRMAFSGLEGYVYSPIKKADSWEQKYFEYPRDEEKIKDWVRTNAYDTSADVYISPVLYNKPQAIKANFQTSQVAWVEFDGERYIDFLNLPRPTAIVQTSSETHWHCYWKIDPVNGQTLEDINRRLTFYLQADTSGWDCTQLLRPPGTFNRKKSRPVLLSSFEGTHHELPVFDVAPKVERAVESTVVQSQLLPIRDVLHGKELSTLLVKQIRLENPVEPHRSSFMAKVANELAEEEFTHLEIVSCLFEIDNRIQKFTGRTDQLLRLSQLADYALAKHLAAEQITVYTPLQIIEFTEDLVWILPGLLHSTGQVIVSSAPGVGKTQLLLQLSYILLTKATFLGMPITDSLEHSILFMSLEMDVRTLKYIFSHQMVEWSSQPEGFHITDEPGSFAKYEKLIEQYHPTVVIIDSLSELLEFTEDANGEAKKVMRWCRRIRRHFQCAVILIHHNRKATEGNKKPKGLSDLAYSFQFGKDTDTVIQLWEDHKGLEFSTVKTRFGPKLEFLITRNQNLWYNRKEEAVVSNKSEPVQPNQTRAFGIDVSFGGHGNQLHKPIAGEISPGPSDNDRPK
jgi:archaellum biogenesis ATPase FlaH